MLGCGFYAQTSSLSVRTNVRFTEVLLVDAGTALKPLVNTVFYSLCLFFVRNHRIQSNQIFLFKIQCDLRYNERLV